MLTDKEKKQVQQKLLKKGLKIESGAKRKCPVDTGRLRSSINTKLIEEYKVRVGTNVEYAPYVEFGTDKMKAQPFLRPATDEVINNRQTQR